MMKTRTLVPLAFALAAIASAEAQTLYKLIDKNGKVTYSESVPKDFDGKVIRLSIDPNANTATLPRPGAEGRNPAPAGASGESRAAKAQADLERAKKALADARDNPGEGEVQRIGTKSGGARPVPTDDYKARLEKLETAVKAAEKDLREAERAGS